MVLPGTSGVSRILNSLLCDLDGFFLTRRLGRLFYQRRLRGGRLLFRSALVRERAQFRQTFEREECADDVRVVFESGPEYEVLARLDLLLLNPPRLTCCCSIRRG